MRRILLVLFALTLLSGCGGADASLFATAVRNTENAGGAELAFQMSVTDPSTGQPVVLTATGVEDLGGRRARIAMQVPGAGEMEVIADKLVMYMRFDALAQELGKEWMKLDLEETYEDLGIDLGGIGQVGQGTSEQLEMIGEVSDGITEEGRETVRGVQTTHYSATIDLRKYPDEDIEKIIDLTGQSEIPMDVWIDDDERVRRMEWEQAVAKGQPAARIVAEYVRFGVPVDIDIPDDDEVYDATNLAVQGIENELD